MSCCAGARPAGFSGMPGAAAQNATGFADGGSMGGGSPTDALQQLQDSIQQLSGALEAFAGVLAVMGEALRGGLAPASSASSASAPLPPAAPVLTPAPEAPAKKLEGLTPNQIKAPKRMSQYDRNGACGIAAAAAFAEFVGKPRTMDEIGDIGKKNGTWGGGAGMRGPDAQVKLLKEIGVDVKIERSVDWEKVKREVQAGRPVIIDTPAHYWVVEGYNPDTGEFNFGESGKIMNAGGNKAWRKPSGLSIAGGARSAIYLA